MTKSAKFKVSVIGCGNMGAALVRGLLASGFAKPNEICACDTGSAKLQQLQKELGVATELSIQRVAGISDVLVIAVKPQAVPEVATEIRNAVSDSCPLIISVAAGVSTATIAKALNLQADIVRVMPNLPCAIGQGVSAYFTSVDAASALVESILASFGKVVRVGSESDIDAVTAVSASGVGFLFDVVDALVQGGTKMGLSTETALTLAAQSMLGAGAICLQSDKTPLELKAMVSSPGGTTLAGLKVLEDRGVKAAFIDAVAAATKRAQELKEGKK